MAGKTTILGGVGALLIIIFAAALIFINQPRDFELSGQLVVVDRTAFPDFRIAQIDLESDERRALFSIPRLGWVSDLRISPDESQIAFAYTIPPRTSEPVSPDRSGIYLLSFDDAGAAPTLLLESEEPNSIIAEPLWSQDSRYLYFITLNQFSFNSDIKRYEFASGQVAVLIANATAPALSADGTRLAYVSVAAESGERSLQIANPNGGNPVELVAPGMFLDINRPVFSPDGRWIYFSAVFDDIVAADFSAGARLLGGQVAGAHPGHEGSSDWWRVPVSGGDPERMTQLPGGDVTFDGAFDAAGEHFAFASATGLYVLETESGRMTQLFAANGYGALDWLS